MTDAPKVGGRDDGFLGFIRLSKSVGKQPLFLSVVCFVKINLNFLRFNPI